MLWVCRALVVLKKGSNQLKEAIRLRQDSSRQNKENEEKKRSSTAESGGQHKNRALLWSVDFLCYLGRVECLAF